MAKRRRPAVVPPAAPAAETPAELPAPEPEPEPEHEPEPLADVVEPAAEADHTAIHGIDSIVSDEREYRLWLDGRCYVHVGEHGGRWVYRPA